MGFIETRIGADGRSRTGTAYAIRPSSVRVYQFHHVGFLLTPFYLKRLYRRIKIFY